MRIKLGVTLPGTNAIHAVSTDADEITVCQDEFIISSNCSEQIKVYDAVGRLIDSFHKESGSVRRKLSKHGLFFVVSHNGTKKIVL